jgi:hypothetical protein
MKTGFLFFSVLFQLSAFALTNSLPEEKIEFESVIFIRNDAPDANGESLPAFCNATLLSKNMAVTAAHCLHYAFVSGEKMVTLEKGAYKYKIMPDGTKRRIGYIPNFKTNVQAEIEFSEKLKDKFLRSKFKAKIGPEEDVAIFWWKDEHPELNLAFFPSLVSPSEEQIIKKSISSFQLSPVSINPFSEMSIDTKRSSILNQTKWHRLNYVESKSTSRVQEGDSGAPLFVTINNQQKVFAVVKGKATTAFGNWDVYSPISQIACDINKRMPTEFSLKSCQLMNSLTK